MKTLLCLLVIFLSHNIFSQIPSNGLICHYPFSGNADDWSGNNYNGVVNGATLTADRFGNFNNAYNFDGVDDRIDLSNYVSAFNNQEPMSISFWVKTGFDNAGATNFASTVFSISEGGTGASVTCVGVGNNSTGTLTNEIAIASYQRTTSDKYIAGFTTTNRDTILDNRWHHIVFDFNNNSTLFYLDGLLINMSCNFGTNNGRYANIASATKVFIGTRWANNALGAFMTGVLDDFRMYNRSLTQSEVISLLNEPNPILSAPEVEVSQTYEFKLFPNPTSERLSLGWSEEIKSDITLNVIDVNGNILMSENITDGSNSHFLNVQNLSKGNYFIQFISEEYKKTEKFIIE